MRELICRTTRYAFFLMLFLTMPLIFCVDYLLKIWLKNENVPEFTSAFIILSLVTILIQTLGEPMDHGLLSEGNIRFYEILLFALNLCNLVLAYLGLLIGLPPISVYWITLFTGIPIVILRLVLSGNAYQLTAGMYCHEVLLRVGIVSALCFLLALQLTRYPADTFPRFFLYCCWIALESLGVICFAGLKKEERREILHWIRSRLKKFRPEDA